MQKLKNIKKFEDNINNQINFDEEIKQIKNEIDEIEKQLFIFDRKKLFLELSQEQFVNVIEREFENDKLIDISGREINDFYFYIYLLKNDMHDEKSYNSSSMIL